MESKHRYPLIDIHAHILPGADDGARTIKESCALIDRAAEAGFRAIVATPHYSRRRGTDGYTDLLEQLQKEIEQTHPDFALYMGHETYYHEELADRLKEGNAFTMAGSRYVLVEFDTGVSFQTLNRALRRLLTSGYVPILAHMERYGCLCDPDKLQEICTSGCLLQMNYESLTGSWFSSEVRRCRKLVKEGRIHFLGTDMHRTDYRPPEVEKALDWLEKHVDPRLVSRMVYKNARKMIKNEKIS